MGNDDRCLSGAHDGGGDRCTVGGIEVEAVFQHQELDRREVAPADPQHVGDVRGAVGVEAERLGRDIMHLVDGAAGGDDPHVFHLGSVHMVGPAAQG